MANFIFDQGAAAFLSGDVDWVGTVWECAIYDETVTPTQDNVYADISAAVVGLQEFPNRLITTSGAASGDAMTFTDLSPTQPDGRLGGLVVKRQSDDLLLAHIDDGFDGIQGQDPGAMTSILGVAALAVTYTFTLTPGANNENAWFRP